MRCHFSPTGLQGDASNPAQALALWLDSVLRGIGQVLFQNNSYSGLLFVLGVAWHSPVLAAAAVLGCAVATVFAQWLGLQRSVLRQGLGGFNGALVGVALVYFFEPGLLTWVCVLLGAAIAAMLGLALRRVLDGWGLAVLTAPFVLATWLFFLASAGLGRLQPSGLLPAATLPSAAAVEGVVSASTWAQGLGHSWGQVFFQMDIGSGLLLMLGVAIASPSAALIAILGVVAGMATAWVLGAPEPAMRAGLWGFNSLLTALALGHVFLPAQGVKQLPATLYALWGAVVCTLLAAALQAALAPIGLPVMTFPFVLTAWGLLLAWPAAIH